jgi:hypothetical protein
MRMRGLSVHSLEKARSRVSAEDWTNGQAGVPPRPPPRALRNATRWLQPCDLASKTVELNGKGLSLDAHDELPQFIGIQTEAAINLLLLRSLLSPCQERTLRPARKAMAGERSLSVPPRAVERDSHTGLTGKSARLVG